MYSILAFSNSIAFDLKKSETHFKFSKEQISFILSSVFCISSTFVSKTSSSISDSFTLDLSNVIIHFFGNIHATLPGSHIFHPNFENICLIFEAVLFLLSVRTCIIIATQPGAYHS